MVEKNWVIPDQTVKFLKILAKKQVKNQCNKCVMEGIFVWNEHYLHRNRVKKSDSIPMDTFVRTKEKKSHKKAVDWQILRKKA